MMNKAWAEATEPDVVKVWRVYFLTLNINL